MGETRRSASRSASKQRGKPTLGQSGRMVHSSRGPKRRKSAVISARSAANLSAPRFSDGRLSETDVPTDHGARLARLLSRLPHRRFAPSIDPLSLNESERLVCLTAREREVLCLYVDHRNSKEVACCLGTRTQTIKNQLATIEHKLGVDSREDLLVFLFSLLD
jgi:DNA-binding CsgD family transcriptional regulator